MLLAQVPSFRYANDVPYLLSFRLGRQTVENDRPLLVAVLRAIAKRQTSLGAIPAAPRFPLHVVEVAADHELKPLGHGVDVTIVTEDSPVAALVAAKATGARAGRLGEGEQGMALLDGREDVGHSAAPSPVAAGWPSASAARATSPAGACTALRRGAPWCCPLFANSSARLRRSRTLALGIWQFRFVTARALLGRAVGQDREVVSKGR